MKPGSDNPSPDAREAIPKTPPNPETLTDDQKPATAGVQKVTSETLTDVQKATAAELAKQFVTYADVIVGFTVAQGLAFVYALAGKTEADGLRAHLLFYRSQVIAAAVVMGCLYTVLVGMCQLAENDLREQADQPSCVRTHAAKVLWGRWAVIAVTTIITVIGVSVSK